MHPLRLRHCNVPRLRVGRPIHIEVFRHAEAFHEDIAGLRRPRQRDRVREGVREDRHYFGLSGEKVACDGAFDKSGWSRAPHIDE